ncbi:MAG: FitA-like ribbon-helix-helix domain-containing protein [Phycisphaerales bacterium]
MRRRSKTMRYDVRNIPPAVDKVLRARARREGKSLNQVVLETLSRVSPVSGAASGKKRDLSRYAGTWRPDRECERVLDEFNEIDPDIWK